MKTLSTGLYIAMVATMTVMLAACAETQAPPQSSPQTSAPAPAMRGGSGGPGAMGAGMGPGSGMGMGMMTPEHMAACRDMQQKMAQAKTPEERQAIMQQHMATMTPEMRQWMQQNMGTNRCQ